MRTFLPSWLAARSATVSPKRPEPTGHARKGSKAWLMMTTTDHKQLGIMYIIMSFSFFFLGGLMALLIRAELFTPGLQFLSNEQFNQLFTKTSILKELRDAQLRRDYEDALAQLERIPKEITEFYQTSKYTLKDHKNQKESR